jgi:hypothetical protein
VSSGEGIIKREGFSVQVSGLTPDTRNLKPEGEETMSRLLAKTTITIGIALMILVFAISGAAQDKPADNMQILRDKIRADKKVLVATNMELTESEAKGFWPVYDEYQKDLQKINRRVVSLLESYAADFRNKSLTDDKAKKLIDEAIAIEVAEANLKSTYAPKLSKALPVKKVARYLQIENKIRAVVKYELAQGVPLVQ